MGARLILEPWGCNGRAARLRSTVSFLMKIFIPGCISLAVSLLACHSLESKSSPGNQVQQCCAAEAPDYEIFGVILESLVPSSTLLVREETFSPQLQSDWLTSGGNGDSVTRNPSLMRELIADYARRNEATRSLAGLKSLRNVRPVTEVQLDRIFANGAAEGYERLKKEFPDTAALIAFSLPGYAQEQSRALVYVDIGRGPLDTQGKVFLLRKIPGEKWRIVETFTIAES